MRKLQIKGEKLLKKELKGGFKFFIKEANTNKKSKGYGLIRDKSQIAPEIASIASCRIWISSTSNRSRKKVDKLPKSI